MKLDGMQLLFGSDDGALEEAQSPPIQRPAPVQRPSGRVQQSAPPAPAAPQQPDAPLDGMELLFGGGQSEAPAPSPQPQAQAQQADPSFWQAPIRSTVQAIRGKQDPAYKDVPEYVHSGDAGFLRTTGAKVLGAGDAAYGDIIARDLGDRLIRRERDANDYEVMVYRGEDGSEKKAYVNKPGLGGEDVNRLMMGALPYLATGGAVGAIGSRLGLGGLMRATSQGAAAGATSLASDAASIPIGSQQNPDLVKAAFAAAGGVAGEAIATGYNAVSRGLTARSLVNRDGTLTAKGIEAARKAGVDPADVEGDIARSFAQTYSMSKDAAEAGVQFSTRQSKIPATRGQVSKDPAQLTREEGMRRSLYGPKAKEVMDEFDKKQQQAIYDATFGGQKPTWQQGGSAPAWETTGVGGRLAPHRDPGQVAPSELGSGIRQGLQSARSAERAIEREAWDAVPDLVAKPGAFDDLPTALSGQLGQLRVDGTVTPTAWRMAQVLDDFVQGKGITPDAPSVLQQAPIRTVDEMRRQLGIISRSAKDPADRAAAGAIYSGFNDWIETAAQKQLLSGAPEAAAQLRTARSITRNIKDLFQPSDRGRTTPASKIIENIMEKADSGESIVAQLFGSGGPASAPKPGSVQALQHIKKALIDRPAARGPRAQGESQSQWNDQLNMAWNDIRLAYWLRIAGDKKGGVATPGRLKSNIDSALKQQNSIVKTLFSPEEIREIQQLSRALERVVYKPPNASGSGYTAAHFGKEFVRKLVEGIGLKSKTVGTALEYTGIGNAYGTAAARRAVSDQISAPPRNRLMSPIGGYTGASQVEPPQ